MTTDRDNSHRTKQALQLPTPSRAEAATELLAQVGLDLDRKIFPVVWNTGLVLPNGLRVPPKDLGKEIQNESTARQRPGFETGSWQEQRWASHAHASAALPSGDGASGEASSFTCRDEDSEIGRQIGGLMSAYPNTRVWQHSKGLWLHIRSFPIPGFEREVGFIVQVEPESTVPVRGWGFWHAGRMGATWIGSRHTNYNDGSICAFDSGDSTWKYWEPLVELIDLYSVWATRHLHLEMFGYWPGPQASFQPYERLLEFVDREHCGCDRPRGTYASCCKPSDQAKSLLALACNFGFCTGWAMRSPPKLIQDFARDGHPPTGLLQE